jgi:zinc protease
MFRTLMLLGLLFAQSGRGRPTAPPPKPPPKPGGPVTAAVNVPENGRVIRELTDGATTRYTLKNGLTVIVRQRASSPLVSITTLVKVGDLNEPVDNPGLARLMARLYFKGKRARQTVSAAVETRRLGGLLQSDVSPHSTSLEVDAPVESLKPILEIQADLLQHPPLATLAAEDVSREAALLADDLSRVPEDVAAFGQARLMATAFPSGQAGHMIPARFEKEIQKLRGVTREQLLSFYQAHYQPQKTVISIVGGVFAPQVIGTIQQLYGTIAPREAPLAAKAEAEPPQDKLRYRNDRGEIGQTVVTIGYHVPGIEIGGRENSGTRESLKNAATLEVLAAVLGLGRGARLGRVLREGEHVRDGDKPSVAGMVSGVATDYLPLNGPGLLSVQLVVDPPRIDRAEAEYFREIERFKREILGEGELARARNLFEKRYYDGLIRVGDESRTLAHYQSEFGDFRILDGLLPRIRAVTAQDVQEAAVRYLTLQNTSVHEYEPQRAQARTFTPESYSELVGVFAPSAFGPVRPEEVKSATALKTFKQGTERGPSREAENLLVADQPLPVKDFSIYRGPRAYVREDHVQPVLAVGVFFQGGRLLEDQSTSGTTELMLRTMLKSTTSKKADLLALELESYGGEIEIVNEPDFFGFTLDVLSRNADPAIKLLVDIAENPYFDQVELGRERDGLLARQTEQKADERARSVELMMASLFPNHPYALPRYGLPASVKAVTTDSLDGWYAKTIKRQFPMVVIVGDTDGSALVSRVFADSFKRGSVDQAIKVNLPVSTSSPEELAEQLQVPLTAQAIGFRGPEGKSDDYYALDVMKAFASGAGGRLTSLVDPLDRADKADHAVYASFSAEPRLVSGIAYAVFASAPGAEQKARQAATAELERLAGAPVTDDEFDLGRNVAIASYAIAIQPHPVRALEYALAVVFGRKASDVDSQPDSIRAVRKTDIKRAGESLIKSHRAGSGVVRGSG